MIVILGKSASGKDYIVNKLVSEHNFDKVITYTTHPMRESKTQDSTYHFITEEEFKRKINNNFFAEWKSYNSELGTWYYGTALNDIKNINPKSLIILTPKGYEDIIKQLPVKPISFYIYANSNSLKKRLQRRGDNKEEVIRRLNQDNIDFKSIERNVNKIIYNNEGTDIEDIINKIIKYSEEFN